MIDNLPGLILSWFFIFMTDLLEWACLKLSLFIYLNIDSKF